MAKQIQGLKRFSTLVTMFDRPQYIIPESKRPLPGWRNLRELVKIDHPEPQAKVIIDNKLIDEVRWLHSTLSLEGSPVYALKSDLPTAVTACTRRVDHV
jgi:hypothetical protein